MTISRQFIALWVLLGAQLIVDFARGDVLRQTDGTVLYGRLTVESDTEIVFHERVDANNYIERRIPRGRIVAIVRTIDEQRLSNLDPKQPEAYRQLAEELAGLQIDPEAHSTAIRLYLIAARMMDGYERRHCLLALVQLSRNPDERRRLGELAILMDASIPRTTLSLPIPSSKAVFSNQAIEELIRAVQLIRSGAGDGVQDTLRKPESRTLLEHTKNVYSAEQLEKAAGHKDFTLDELNSLIKLELALRELSRGERTSDAAQSWFQQSQDEQLAAWKFPTWGNVTEFDPSASVFRQGQWQLPPREKNTRAED